MGFPFADLTHTTRKLQGDLNDRSPSVYDMGGSLIFDGAERTFLRHNQVDGNRHTYTISMWVRRHGPVDTTYHSETVIGHNVAGPTAAYGGIGFDSNNNLGWFISDGTPSQWGITTTMKFLDTSAFYHILCVHDTTQASASERMKLYINGELTSGNYTAPPQNTQGKVNNAAYPFTIGIYEGLTDPRHGQNVFNGEIADIGLCDGQALGPEHFGWFDSQGVWRPKKVDTSTWTGVNSFFLNFAQDITQEGNSIVEWQSTNTTNDASLTRKIPTTIAPDLTIVGGVDYPSTLFTSLFDSKRQGYVSATSDTTKRNFSDPGIVTIDGENKYLETAIWYNNLITSGVAYESIAYNFEASPDYGLEILEWSGDSTNRSLPHSLGEPVDILIVNKTSDPNTAFHYHVYARGITDSDTKTLWFDSAVGVQDFPSNKYWSNSLFSSTIIGLGNHNATNGSGETYIAYAFTAKTGYSHYEALTLAAGANTITCGFRPRIVLWKQTSATTSWHLVDLLTKKASTLDSNLGTVSDVSALFTNVTDTGFDISYAAGQQQILFAFADTSQARDVFTSLVGSKSLQPVNFNWGYVLSDSKPQKPSLKLDYAASTALGDSGVTSKTQIVQGGYRLVKPTSGSGRDEATLTHEIPLEGNWYFEVDSCQSVGFADPDVPASFHCQDSYTAGQYWMGGYFGGSHSRRRIACLINNTEGTIEFKCSDGFSIKKTYKPINLRIFSGLAATNVQATDAIVNFGQRPFVDPMPQGYRPLKDIVDTYPTVIDPSKFFRATSYVGDGVDGREITTGVDADLIWVKATTAANWHISTDTIRPVNETLYPNATTAGTVQATPPLKEISDTGFTVSNDGNVNKSGDTYIAWSWKKSPQLGFDVVKYTGTGHAMSLSHECGGTPDLILVKNIDEARPWQVHLRGITTLDTNTLELNTSGTLLTTSSAIWDVSSMSPKTFGVGVDSTTNWATKEHIAYLWRSVPGFSKIGTYIGNGNVDGPFASCGFKPAWVMIKALDTVANWYILDTTRTPIGESGRTLAVNSPSAQDNGWPANEPLLIHSNGFKITRGNVSDVNQSGIRYMFMAFAEKPQFNTNAR
ncbi:hypothetical protein GR7B_00153 [Vibrio phage vB_VcorM_GR7B]|nr:hypothetical protein GR7B_00153 [Vibrio phage vB_VcorM_GR7B]